MTKRKFESHDIMVCIDCGFYCANGMPDEHEPSWSPDKFGSLWEKDWDIVNGDSDKDDEFSSTPCESCGSRLGSARMHCVAMKEIK